MFSVVRFCVQPYHRVEGDLVRGEAEPFYDEPSAIRTSLSMRKRVAGVAVYRVKGWPVQDLWARPEAIAKFGLVPDDDFASRRFRCA